MARHTQTGFFLTDILTGLFLLSVVSGGLLSIFGHMQHASRLTDETVTALIMTKSCLADPNPAGQRQYSIDRTQFIVTKTISLSEEDTTTPSLTLESTRCTTSWTHRQRTENVTLSHFRIATD